MQSTVMHCCLSRENPTRQKAERNRGYEGILPRVPSWQPALAHPAVPKPSVPWAAPGPQPALGSRWEPRGGHRARSGRLRWQFSPRRAVPTALLTGSGRAASCLPRVTQPRPGLNPRCATRPRRHGLRR